jgi:LuxR family quorum-sensing system transcriptional regulator CciR
MATIEDFIEATNQVKSIDELSSLYEKALAGLGFDQFIFSFMNEHIELNEDARHGVIKNYPDSWLKYYKENNYYNCDPVVSNVLCSHRPFFWKDIVIADLSEKQVMDEAKESGLHDGIGLSMSNRFGSLAGVGVASSTGGADLNKKTLSIVQLISYQFYNCYIDIASEEKAFKPINFSAREGDVLKYASRGNTKVEIAEKLNISRHTVDYHVRNILKKTDSPNLLSAIMKAVRYHYIVI